MGHSESGIELYDWDFDYDDVKGFKSTMLIDRVGKLSQTFKAGTYTVTVKAVDDEGLESVKTIKLKVNSVVEKL